MSANGRRGVIERESKEPGRPRAKGWIGCAAILAVGVLCGAGTLFAMAGSNAHKLDVQLQAARREGIPLEPKDLARNVPESENAAPIYLDAFKRMDAVPKAKEAILLNAAPGSTEWRDQAKALLAPFQPALARFLAATKRPHCDFHRDWSQGAYLAFPELSKHKQAVGYLVLEARVASAEGRPDEALDLLQASARAAAHLSEDRVVISSLVEAAEEAAIDSGLQDVLGAHGLEPGVADRVAAVVHAFGPPLDFRASFGSEVVMSRAVIKTLADPRASQSFFSEVAGTGTNSTTTAWLAMARYKPVRDAFETRTIEHWRGLFESMPQDPTRVVEAYGALKQSSDRLDRQTDWSYALVKLLGPVFQNVPLVAGQSLEYRRDFLQAVAAIKLRQKTGRFPTALPLSGADSVDPITGNPLRYRYRKDGFLIYGVGMDRKDDGGLRKKPTHTEGDIVVEFPYRPISDWTPPPGAKR